MNYKLVVRLFFIWLYVISINGQHKEQLLTVINSISTVNEKQIVLDSLLQTNVKNLTSVELADYYHDYAYQWYFKKRWLEENRKEFLEEAIILFEKSIALKKGEDNPNSSSIIRTLYNLGVLCKENNEFFKAIDAFLEITTFKKADKKTMYGYRELGRTYSILGDYYKALANNDEAILLAKKNTFLKEKLIEGYLNHADIYSLMGYQEYSNQIRTNIKKADSLLKNNLVKTSKYRDRIYQIEGNRLLRNKKYSDAINCFNKVLENLHPLDSFNRASVYNSIGLSFLFVKQFDTARSYIQKSIEYDPSFTAAYENMGDLYIENKEFSKGLLEYQRAIQYNTISNEKLRVDGLISKDELEVAINKYYLLHHLIQKANGWMQYYHFDKNRDHLKEALATFKTADQLVDIIRFESTEYKSKLFWREKGASLYMKAVEACYLLKQPEEAYYFMEKNKALLLLEDITNEQAKENAQLPVKVARREFELKQAIYLLENELNISKDKSGDQVQSLKDKIYASKDKYERFVDSIALAFPKYATNKKKITVLPYKTFETKYVSNEEMVLQYILNKDQGYGLLTAKDESVFFEIKDVTSLQEHIYTLRKQSSQLFQEKEDLIVYHENANKVFQQIIPDRVYQKIKGKKLTILPDYTLQQVSFDVLTTSKQKYSYLIKDTEIRYGYSISYLDRNKDIKRTSKYPFIGFAPVTFETKGLADLVLSKEEVSSISGLLSGNSLTEEKATKSNFLDTIALYKVIHLSTHADIGTTEDPWIAFKDEKLSLNEIYATKNQSEMVVLSACKTSLGELRQGEGVMSLARGFFHSGANSVVSSLWATNDKSSKELMIDFYKELNTGVTKAAALRSAKLNYINSHYGTELSPFYWGGVILIGDNATLSLSSGFFETYWIGIIMIMVVLTALLFYVGRNRSVS